MISSPARKKAPYLGDTSMTFVLCMIRAISREYKRLLDQPILFDYVTHERLVLSQYGRVQIGCAAMFTSRVRGGTIVR